MALATFTITNDGQFLLVTSTTTGDVESINLNEIKDITNIVLSPSPGTYPYVDMNQITIEANGREADFTFDLAAVTNQAGWTLNQAGCIQCQDDIRGWSAAAAGGGGATEATLQALLTEVSDSSVRTGTYTNIAGANPLNPAPDFVAAGARSVSFFNNGPTNATIQGTILAPGKSIEFDAGGENDVFGTFSYITVATGDLDILTVV